jgi:hypothetical protein
MIRRHVGNEFFLIAQHDHALLAGEFARHFGNAMFAQPDPFDPTIQGTSLHDCGWPLHDDAPTLNPAGLPLDVFEVSRPIALKVWSASADRASAMDAYAGLLTSIHVLSLSVFATTQTSFQHEKFDTSKLPERFEVNKFQHREIERQQELRARLGLSTEIPLHNGLAPTNRDPREQRLTFDLRLLQAMDLTSLAICCTKPPVEKTQDVLTSPGGNVTQMRFDRKDATTLSLDPWPFDQECLGFQIPFRRVPGRAYASESKFQETFAQAPIEHLTVTLTK